LKGPTIANNDCQVVITGVGLAAPEPLSALGAAPPSPPPEITAFEVPEGTPAWGFEVLDLGLERELPNIKTFVDRTSALALVAAKRALADAGLSWPPPSAIGCAYGTMLGCLEAMSIFWNKVKATNPKFAPPLTFTHAYANSPSSLLCIEFGLRGSAATFSGEPLAGLEALAFAFDQLVLGGAEIILAGASDSLTPAAHRHLCATGRLSRSGRWEDGLIPGEGGVMLVLENKESARKRGAKIYAVLEDLELFTGWPAKPAICGQDFDKLSRTDARGPGELLFSSLPGGWPEEAGLFPEMPVCNFKLYAGDMLAATPVLGVALAAQALRLGAAFATGLRGDLRSAVALGYDPSGTLGMVRLKRDA
jgi:hypothetical protein